MEKLFFEWPDIARQNHISCDRQLDSLSNALWATRSGDFSHQLIQSFLLTRKDDLSAELQDTLIALGFLYYSRIDASSFTSVLNQLRSIAPERIEVRAMTIVFWLWKNDISSINSAPSGIWNGLDSSLLMRICRSFYFLKIGKISDALDLISDEPSPPLEIYLLKAQALSLSGNYLEAVMLLKSIRDASKRNLRFCTQLIQHQFEAKDGSDLKQNLTEALSLFGEHPQLLHHCTSLNLFQRQPGLARRSALLQQTWASVTTAPIAVGNQVNSYEANGSSDWTEYLSTAVTSLPLQTNAQLHSNLIMQLASSESKKYKEFSTRLVSALHCEKDFQPFKNAPPGVPCKPKARKKLRIGWVSGDVYYHPVSRFLLGFFASAKDCLSHTHEIISTQAPGSTSLVQSFREECGVDVMQLSGNMDDSRVSAIRSRDYDITIDLSGWTGGNFVAGFLSRLSPIQINYLGYFASTALPTMDYWIGDHYLFPPQFSEWSTEQIVRLPRPFIAWKPVDPLPEARVGVTEPPLGPVRFGSFNHNRKLTDKTLSLWSKVLAAVPGSRLVLKASHSTDSDTQRLLRRRMQRQGLDPQRLIG